MIRDEFLKKLQYFDDNYNGIVHNDKELDELYKTNKKFNDDERSRNHSQHHSRINISRVKQLMLTKDDYGKDNNCFVPFYNLSEIWLNAFFEQLSNTELGLHYIDGYADGYRGNQTLNRNKALQRKIDSVLEYAEAVGTRETTIEDIKSLRNSLDNQHLTKHRLFENLLYWMAVLLNDIRNSHIVANTTNAIIKDYFGIEDINFSRYAKIGNYTVRTYTYYDAKGIILHHS